MNKSKILFIINPKSGTGKQDSFLDILSTTLNNDSYEYDTVYTEYGGHATELSKESVNKYDIVVAVGGDGTVNEVSKGLIGSDCVMGIIPVGSGNGLARHLNLPVRVKDAIMVINEKKIKKIDTATLNGESFVNVAGIGFDAHIAHLFANSTKRGPIPYAKIATQEFHKYIPQRYKITIDGIDYSTKAFLISFANSSQFGNNAYISPNAIINDGLLDFCIMKEFPKIEAGQLAVKLFNKRMDKSKYMNIVRGVHIDITSDDVLKGHIDGEPIDLPNKISVSVKKESLKVIYNTNKSIIDVIGDRIKEFVE
jgi:YegS/Rv2252/BmrU family lipid kinase